MDRRAFFKSVTKIGGGTVAALAVLQWRTGEAEKDVEKLQSKVDTLQKDLAELKGFTDALYYRTQQLKG